MELRIIIGNDTLTALLADNTIAKDFVKLLPLTVKMDDYFGTEKIFYPNSKLSTTNEAEGFTRKAGDITYYVPWGNVAIFYRDFRYSPGLVYIGHIENDISCLQVSGSINSVRFELIDNKSD